MEAIRSYIVMIGGFLIFQALLEGLLPAHTSRKYIRLVMGAIFLLVLFQPLQRLLRWNIAELPEVTETGDNPYESRVQQMTAAQYESLIREKGLPPEDQERWTLTAVSVDCTADGRPEMIRAELHKGKTTGSIEPIRIDLGSIGAGEDKEERAREEEQWRQKLAVYWGIEAERLQVRIEGE